jgi:hypothetical protein
MAEASDDPNLRLNVTNRLLIALICRGNLETPVGRRTLAVAKEASSKAGDILARFGILSNLGVHNTDQLQFAAARRLFAEARNTIPEHAGTYMRHRLACNLGELALWEGDMESAAAHFAEALSVSDTSVPSYARQIAVAGGGLAALKRGALPEARDFASEFQLPSAPWTFDCSVPVLFHAQFTGRAEPQFVLTSLVGAADAYRDRMIGPFVKLSFEALRVLKRTDPGSLPARASELRLLVDQLGWTRWTSRIAALM